MAINTRRDSAATSAVALAALFTASISAESSSQHVEAATAHDASAWFEDC
ncbi:hypothetical protein J8246_07850 [Corynebacterium tuberculostearicum]|nr:MULTISPECIES: hypothetical protein [Corynebacterium]MCG7465749.1 hypothetical protein [Corynebacterium sp. ACRPJ]WKE52316.1 hypothetical protein J8246_07850 [Corynebacterium tuberculostearicum]